MTSSAAAGLLLAAFNTAAPVDAQRDAARCCVARAFTAGIVTGRPYADLDALDAAIDAQFAQLGWDDVTEALGEHPRIGEPARGGWSAAEQAGAAGAPPAVADELAAGNRAYEERFGHVFLICATGLTATQLLDGLRARLDNDPATERRVVTDELRKITRLRMRKLLGG
jgi:2-oxo-4-hydroxy-4-carboxy-5-ureidoimidazoline decarboxylase